MEPARRAPAEPESGCVRDSGRAPHGHGMEPRRPRGYQYQPKSLRDSAQVVERWEDVASDYGRAPHGHGLEPRGAGGLRDGARVVQRWEGI